jgi:arachidonate 15-lipoxygenase
MVMKDTNSPQQGQAPAYRYNYTYIEPIAMVDQLPQGENFSQPWIVLIAKQVIKIAINTLIANRGDRGKVGIEDDVREFLSQILFQTIQETGKSFKPNLVRALTTLLPQLLLKDESSSTTAVKGVTTKVSTTVETAVSRSTETVPPVETEVKVSRTVETTVQPTVLAEPSDNEIFSDPSEQPLGDLEDIRSEDIRSIEVGLQYLLESEMPAEVGATRGIEPPLLQSTVPSAQTKAAVSQGIDQALQRPLPGMPVGEADVEKFVTSHLIKVLGEDFLKCFANNLLNGLKDKAPKGHASSLEDYRKLFTYLDLPESASLFQDDEFFASMRVAGPNPVMIERMTTADARFPVTEAQYKAVMGDQDSLQTAMQEGRIYLADYAVLDGALNGTYGTQPQTQKYAYAPLAMFAVPAHNATKRLLRPVAIQCGQSPTDYPVITPATGSDAWLMAKTIVQIADANFHEAVSHFARTHLLIEPFVTATHRQLPATHPLFQLLVPHFQGTLAINYAAHEFLVSSKGGVNGLLSSTIDNSRVLMVKGLRIRGFNADMLPRRLQARGVADLAALPVYPYRDDGLLIWAAIRNWVKDYLGLYYQSNADVKGDRAVQSWAQELVAFDGGRLQGFGDREEGQIETLDYLIDAVTMVIFTGSAQHAAVNFPQDGIMSFAPAMPTAGYLPATVVRAEATQKDWLELLPPLGQAQTQLNLLHLLGSVYFTKLGSYEDGHFADSRVVAPLLAFQNRLKEIEAIIDQRNGDRPPYNYLKPSKIPQSINI